MTKTTPTPLLERLSAKIVVTRCGCWEWRGAVNRGGYGVIGAGRRTDGTMLVHRAAWSELVGEIPRDLYIDHVCRNRLCCNPNHFEIVSHRVNNLRGGSPAAVHARQSHCLRGHPFDDENTRINKRGQRCCRACRRLRYTTSARRVA